MSDIVEQLRALASYKHDDLSIGNDAADEIEALRQQLGDVFDEKKILSQRVKELEFKIECLELSEASFKDSFDKTYEELAALKQSQGEPVAVAHVGNRTFYVTANPRQLEKMGFSLEDSFDIPLYTAAQTIPEGWQIVPVEPTDKMREFICDCYCDGQIDTYKSMLAAAPKPEK